MLAGVACIGFLAYLTASEFGKLPLSFGFSTLALILYSQIDLFQEGLEFLSLRFEEAANVEGNPLKLTSIATTKCLSHLLLQLCGRIGWVMGLGGATRAGAALGGGLGGAENAWSQTHY